MGIFFEKFYGRTVGTKEYFIFDIKKNQFVASTVDAPSKDYLSKYTNLKLKRVKRSIMKTVKQKLEAQVKRIEDTFPQLITNQMYLGTKDHPDLKLWNETSWLVGSWTLSKWRNLKYILKVWNSLDLSKPNAVVLEIDHLLRKSGYYHLAKLLREEQKWEEA
jgi:hypothetical protein